MNLMYKVTGSHVDFIHISLWLTFPCPLCVLTFRTAYCKGIKQKSLRQLAKRGRVWVGCETELGGS